MGRPLSTDPDRRRLQIFRRIYSNYFHWKSEIERGNTLHFLNVEGEEIFFHDLLIGIDLVPPRQRLAFELHLLLGMTEREAAERMGFMRDVIEVEENEDGDRLFTVVRTGWITLVSQYSTDALKVMVEAYDCYIASRDWIAV